MSDETAILARLRADGWSVAVHNDYKLDGMPHTFWLFTRPDRRWIKGEGRDDASALRRAFEDSQLPDVRGGILNAKIVAEGRADRYGEALSAIAANSLACTCRVGFEDRDDGWHDVTCPIFIANTALKAQP